MTTNNKTCLFTPPQSPISLKDNTTRKQNNIKKEKSNGSVYPSYKRKQPQDLKVNTTGISKCNNNTNTNNNNNNNTNNELSSTSIYPMINQMSVAERQVTYQKISSASSKAVISSTSTSSLSHQKYMERVMENTNLICSFLKTICVGMPMDDSYLNYGLPSPIMTGESNGHLKKSNNNKVVSLEIFVANILFRTKLTDTFVIVALLFVNKYIKARHESQKYEEMMSSLQFASPQFSIASTNATSSSSPQKNICKKEVVLPKSMATKLAHTSTSRRRHSISKSESKMKMNSQALECILQCQSNSTTATVAAATTTTTNTNNTTISTKKMKDKEGNDKLDSRIVVSNHRLPKESLVKTQKDLIFAAFICSSKYLDDNSYCNTAWVKLTNKTLEEVCDLEREFLMTLKYELYFSNKEWNEWFTWITDFKILLDTNMATTPVEESSPSNSISVPSQSPLSLNVLQMMNPSPSPSQSQSQSQSKSQLQPQPQQPPQPQPQPIRPFQTVLPSPIDVTTPISANSTLSKIPFSFDEEEIQSQNENINTTLFLPSLSTIAAYANNYSSMNYNSTTSNNTSTSTSTTSNTTTNIPNPSCCFVRRRSRTLSREDIRLSVAGQQPQLPSNTTTNYFQTQQRFTKLRRFRSNSFSFPSRRRTMTATTPMDYLEPFEPQGMTFISKEEPQPQPQQSYPSTTTTTSTATTTNSSFYIPLNHGYNNFPVNTINTSLLSQVQNATSVDFTELLELSQKQNFVFKKPILPTIPPTTNPYDIVNMPIKLNPTTNSATNYFMPFY